MIALLIIDMQVSLFEGNPPRYDAEGVVRRINHLSEAVRQHGGLVIFIQHEEQKGNPCEPNTAGWEILPTLTRQASDLVLSKEACDSFYGTNLQAILKERGVNLLIMTGCATDFCVDTTIRAAASKDFQVVVAADGHTTRDRPHLDAKAIIVHHNWMWENLILPKRQVQVLPTEKIIKEVIQ